MVKIKIEDGLKRSYYVPATDTIHLRRDYKNDKEEQKVLEHEITHALIGRRTWWQIFFHLKTYNVFWAVALILSTAYIEYNFETMADRQAIVSLNEQLQRCSFTNITNGGTPFNLTSNNSFVH